MVKKQFNSELFKFAVFPDYEGAITFLADSLADKEPWDFSDSVKKNNSILKNYLEFTFRKLQQEKKITFTTMLYGLKYFFYRNVYFCRHWMLAREHQTMTVCHIFMTFPHAKINRHGTMLCIARQSRKTL